MAHYKLQTPLSESDVRQLKAGDTVTVDGHIFGIRDATQIAMFDKGRKPVLDLNGAILLHVAPSVKKLGPGKYEKVCVGTTTSTRMNRFTLGLLRDYGVRAITGKSGLYQDSVDAMKEYGGVYFAIVGGAASVETLQVEEIEKVDFEDLLPECLWQFRVKDFGPLTVAIDSHGNNLYADVKAKVRDNLKRAYKNVGVE